MKPKSWRSLPLPVLEHMLWDCELEYDGYESSKSETIHGILNLDISDRNKRILDEYYSRNTDEFLLAVTKNIIESTKGQLTELTKLAEQLSGANHK